MKSIVVAIDTQNGIGAANDLLWLRDMPDDLRHFREVTMGNTVVMGRRTYESIGKPLAGRQNIVVSRSGFETDDDVTVVTSLDEAYAAAEQDVMVIGGGQLYAAALDDMDRLYVTQIGAEFPQATVFFPQINCEDWQEVSRDHHEADERNKYDYDFVVYEKVTN